MPFSFVGGIGEVKQVSPGLVLSAILHRLKLLQTSFLCKMSGQLDVGVMGIFTVEMFTFFVNVLSKDLSI